MSKVVTIAPKKTERSKVDNHAVLKAIVIGAGSGETQKDEDEWSSVGNQVLTPPLPPLDLVKLIEYSSELNQCIDAMEVNIAGFGFEY